MTDRPTEQDWQSAIAALRSAERVLLVSHIAPDADTLGSALAVGIALRSQGTDVQITVGENPFVLPRVLHFLPGLDLLVPVDEVRAASVAVAFDASALDRLGLARKLFDAAETRLAFDHHRSHEPYADIVVVDTDQPATAVLALELTDRLGVELDQDMATCLYAGLITDTGSFRFAGTTPLTHEIAARLLATGIRHDEIARHVYDDEPFTAVQLLGVVLSGAVLDSAAIGGAGFVYTVVPAALRQAQQLPLDALERVIDVLRTTTEAEVTAVLKEDDHGSWRVSLRSKGIVDVSALAARHSGGGHRYAAGYTAHGSSGEVIAELRISLSQAEVDELPTATHR